MLPNSLNPIGESTPFSIGPYSNGGPATGHDLEYHIESLRELDKLRRRSAELRDQGHEALIQLILGHDPCVFRLEELYIEQWEKDNSKSWKDLFNEDLELEKDNMKRSLNIKSIPYDLSKRYFENKYKDIFSGGCLVDYVTALRVFNKFANYEKRNVESSFVDFIRQRLTIMNEIFNIEIIKNEKYSIHVATELMRALLTEPSCALSPLFFRCWYWIVRELYIAVDPDWCVGGARPIPEQNNEVSAYTTARCVQATIDFVNCLDTAAKFFSEVARIVQQIEDLNESTIPDQWIEIDKRRLAKSGYVTLRQLSKNLCFEISLPNSIGAFDEAYFMNDLRESVIRAIGQAQTSVDKILEEITQFRDSERSYIENSRSSMASSTAHEIAYSFLKHSQESIGKMTRIAASSEISRFWSDLSDIIKHGANQVRLGLSPVKNYLSTVIDRQLSAGDPSSKRQLDAPDLAWAAAAYAMIAEKEITRQDDDKWLRHAATCLDNAFTGEGTIPRGHPFYTDESGSSYSSDTIGLYAFAELIRRVGYPLDLLKSRLEMLKYLEKTFVEKTEVNPPGWRSKYGSPKPHLERTAEAVEVLASINHMYDEGINEIIFEHFSVKRPGELKETTGLVLDQLFYPDYGFANLRNPELRQEPAAIVLQKMRRHITGGRDVPKSERLHSLVLHGPAGTGKTTFVEALALTCGVPLVEVTPSDIAKGGQDDIERQARVAFESLSLLTRVVILFDEFDPLLKRRDTSAERAASIFTFLTPGMLPKLKTLSERAKKRHVAYVLITNLIGTLDEAAIRDGRFDLKLGVYPPDPLSRYGRLAWAYGARFKSEHKSETNLQELMAGLENKLAEVVRMTPGKGMVALNRNGWFGRLRSKEPEPETPSDYLLSEDGKTITVPEAEDQLNGIRGQGAAAEKEFKQWSFLRAWDEFAKIDEKNPENTKSLDQVLGWPHSDQELKSVISKANYELKGKDYRRRIAFLGDELKIRWSETSDGLNVRLKQFLNGDFTISKARHFCSTHIFSADDLLIFKLLAQRALDCEILEDTGVVSSIIYIHILAKELFDNKNTLENYLRVYEDDDEKLVAQWDRLKILHQKIENEMINIWPRISEDYDAYKMSSSFIAQLVNDRKA
ncbi:ATP-binding protein [Methylocapsa palsarum]|uniref:ATPase family associated with various cellular activities (AAA) n=1 Tax=Methylocapsa palsarum TaxID=1612308 RepID=A0A1I4CK86_9HYPH|nr:ATP-binding protein [Methylocapsa palsarum]SFK80486.1 ATPase family associated with various cellular activities (AAA) [Methylocapsa palsarum]